MAPMLLSCPPDFLFLRIPHPRRGPAIAPRVIAAGGDLQQTTHRGDRMAGLVHFDELEDPDGTEPVSRANQAFVGRMIRWIIR